MRIATWLCMLAFLANLTGCGDSGADRSAPSPAAAQEFVAVAPRGDAFALTPSGTPFEPLGFNYDHDDANRLLEDYWDEDWSRVVGDFEEMAALDANVVRIHLQFGRFMVGPETPDDRALDRLARVVQLAERLGVYLDITGLGAHRAADVPEWYLHLADEQARWDAQATFWGAVAGRVGSSPAVFAYDLVNEPRVPANALAPGEWLGPEFAGFHYTQAITLDRAGRDAGTVLAAWIATMTTAIRAHDERHLVTVGMLPDGIPATAIADTVDFVSVHVYPESGRVDKAVRTVQRFDVDKPVLVEETYPLHCSVDELEQFMTDPANAADGFLGFYWGDPPEELAGSEDLRDALQHDWLTLFEQITT
jgi:hypothetical protein